MKARIETQIKVNSSDGLTGIKDVTDVTCKDAKTIIGVLQTLPIFYDKVHLETVYKELVSGKKHCEHTLTVNGMKRETEMFYSTQTALLNSYQMILTLLQAFSQTFKVITKEETGRFMATIDEYIKNHGFNVNAAKYMKVAEYGKIQLYAKKVGV